MTLSEATSSLYDSLGIATGPGMHPYVACIGEGFGAIWVYLVRKPRGHELAIPTEWEGWPVKTMVTGRMRLG